MATDLGLRFDPEAKPIEVRNADLAFAHSVDQMLKHGPGGLPISRSSASAAEDHAAHLISQTPDFFRISRGSVALCKVEELLLLVLPGLNAVLARDVRWEGDALPHGIVPGPHDIIMHQIGAVPCWITLNCTRNRDQAS